MRHLPVTEGMVFHIIKELRPELAERIREKGELKTAVIGLGRQGTKHAKLMRDYGTNIVAGIAPGKGGTRIHETIPVYNTVGECMKDHPDLAAVSIWRHYSTAKASAIEAIEAGIPIVVLITEGIPLKDVRDILVKAREYNTLLIGGNTPGVIFPPEGIKIGMLPDVFHPELLDDGNFGPHGVSIISRSGAILYHLSDALASAGIAQNAVLGVGGDGAIGSTFRRLVPLVMRYPHTDLVVIAGEIGGCQEEMLAKDIMEHPERYPKPIVAVISGAHAPEGKTMGHAGAIVTPGQEFGTYRSKKVALERAGVTVVNSQEDLIKAVKEKLGGRQYFSPEVYYEKMRKQWESPPEKPTWGTVITKVEPNNLIIHGYRLQDLVERKGLVEVATLLIRGELPESKDIEPLNAIAVEAALQMAPKTKRMEGEDISKTLARYMLMDDVLAAYMPEGEDGPLHRTLFILGRMARYIAEIFGTSHALDALDKDASFTDVMGRVFTGEEAKEEKSHLLEAMTVACVDHGVTPPSAQATLIAASVRAAPEVAVAHGVGAITDVHGGAGAKACKLFRTCIAKAEEEGISLEESMRAIIQRYVMEGKRIEGLGHRIHRNDPRRDVLWTLAEDTGVSGPCVALSRVITDIFRDVRGMNLPINVDGVIGAIVGDMGLEPDMAKAIFIFGRCAGLCAHYYEEITTQPPMRRIVFGDAVYKGKGLRDLPP